MLRKYPRLGKIIKQKKKPSCILNGKNTPKYQISQKQTPVFMRISGIREFRLFQEPGSFFLHIWAPSWTF